MKINNTNTCMNVSIKARLSIPKRQTGEVLLDVECGLDKLLCIKLEIIVFSLTTALKCSVRQEKYINYLFLTLFTIHYMQY